MKKWMKTLMAGTLALSVMAPVASFAATEATVTGVQAEKSQEVNKKEKHEELMTMIEKYTPELAEQFQAIYDKREETMTKMKSIRDQVKAGILTEEEAQTRLKELGVNFGRKGFGGKVLDEETKAQVDAIREQVKAGILTEEEAQTKLKDLGVNLHNGQNQLRHQLDEALNTNDETKIKALLKEMLTKMQSQQEK